MIRRADVIDLYRLILDREPESEIVITEKRRAKSAAVLAFEMLRSDEFIEHNGSLLLRKVAEMD